MLIQILILNRTQSRRLLLTGKPFSKDLNDLANRDLKGRKIIFVARIALDLIVLSFPARWEVHFYLNEVKWSELLMMP